MATAAIGAIGGGIASGYLTGEANKSAADTAAASSRYGADIQNQISQRELAAQQAQNAYQAEQSSQLANAYRSAYQNVGNQYATGETNLNNLYNQSPEELQTLKQQALTGQSEELQQGAGQLNAALAQQGVRGGQAATQMSRGIGEMTKNASQNIQGIMANEAMQRAGEKRQYTAGQQQAQQEFILNPQSAQYSQNLTSEQKAKLQNLMQNYQDVGKPTPEAAAAPAKKRAIFGTAGSSF